MKQWRILINHNKLQGFYNSKYRYSPEFEQAYHIFEEEELGDNSIRITDGLNVLEKYKESSLHDPDELHPQRTRWDSKTRQQRRITLVVRTKKPI